MIHGLEIPYYLKAIEYTKSEIAFDLHNSTLQNELR